MRQRKTRNPEYATRCRLEALEPRRLMAADLRVSELNYHPHAPYVEFGERDSDADDFEFIEVVNAGDESLNLNGYRFTAGVSFRFGSQLLRPGEHLVVAKDLKDFRSRFGSSVPIAVGSDGSGGDDGEYGGSLNNAGELVELRDPNGQVVQQFTYYDRGEWPWLADGLGSSLEVIDATGDLNDPKNWRPSAMIGGSPGTDGGGFPQDVVINELLTHTDLPDLDEVELMNRSDDVVSMNDWYLSDTADNLRRFRIPADQAQLNSQDYVTFNEEELGFRFDGQEADEIFLIETTPAGKPSRFIDVVAISATQNGVTLGRWSNGYGELFPMIERSFEDPNAGPLIGDVVISEFHYHPAIEDASPLLTEDDLEFIEITNQSTTLIVLDQWRIRQAVDFTFSNGTVIRPGETIVLVGFDPNANGLKTQAWLDQYHVPAGTQLLGPYSDADDPNADQLDDDGETIILERPEDIEQLGRGYVLVDRVIYKDQAPWPESADGGGDSLIRKSLTEYGDFASSWQASIPSPGRSGLPGDVDGNGLVDAHDIDQTCTAVRLGGQNFTFDHNRDGQVNDDDMSYLIESILKTSLGDSNLDGVFNSRDFVVIFIAGEYEDGVPLNSGWATGDWNCDFEFDTGDMVAAFQAGGYVSDATPAATATEAPHLSETISRADAMWSGASLGVDTLSLMPKTPPEAESHKKSRLTSADGELTLTKATPRPLTAAERTDLVFASDPIPEVSSEGMEPPEDLTSADLE